MIRRIIVFIAILISIAVLPYWIYFPFIVLAAILFPFYWEGIFLTFFAQVLYRGEISILALWFSPVALSILILIIILIPLRSNIRFHV